MADDTPSNPPSPPGIPVQLHAIAQLLRQADHLDPEAQQTLADLVDELGNMMGAQGGPSPEVSHLAETTAQLAQALYREQEPEAVNQARSRLREAIVRAETGAPVAAGLAERLIEALSNIGI